MCAACPVTVELTARGYRGLLRRACSYAAENGLTLVEVLNGIGEEVYDAAMTGEGLFDIQSTSNAGQSVTAATTEGAPGKSDIGDASELLLSLAEGCLAENPALTGLELCACVMGKLPARGVRSFRESHITMGPQV